MPIFTRKSWKILLCYLKQHVSLKQHITSNSSLLKLLDCHPGKRKTSGMLNTSYIVALSSLLSLYLISVKRPILSPTRCFHQVYLITHRLKQTGKVSHEGTSSSNTEKEVGRDQPYLCEELLNKPSGTTDVLRGGACSYKGMKCCLLWVEEC